ncbi:M20 aminoacylase family protein [uncultured Ramlibacter sp.]|uniref:M20 aminoacylase family protein n=1 Tax=uncultured Ramlibacter sp. TaxID=260755 RepID=UPI002634836B|nr:M20 aminoacylase family protein [uncultured Ramlibacter sp.]
MSTAYKAYCQVGDLADAQDFLTQIRHQLHRNPELSFKEAATAEMVASRLTEWGYEVTRNVGGHGVVGRMQLGDGQRKVSLRADMDALPILEASGVQHASQVAGAMHACGHDGHTTMLLGAARQLARTKQFSGTLNLVFQPAEEGGRNSGAQQMIADGLFERFPCDAIFGLHNHPGAPAGTFLFGSGPFMSASDTVEILIHGKGGHAARPHLAVDPILIAGSLVMALQSVVARNIDPVQTAVVTIGTLNAGIANNVIPESASMGLSVRSFHPAVRDRLQQRITELVTQHVAGYGGTVEIDYHRGHPVLVNSAAETEFARGVAEELVGSERTVAPFGPVTGSEDFAHYLLHRPGCFLRLGNGEASPMLHNAAYDFNDANLTVGAAYWTRLVERFLAPDAAAA